ncbi:MAG: HNH endonuclease [Planctomycetaceae bacterium]|nr:HNH endonuclease [Planctomycetaceae bacterium]
MVSPHLEAVRARAGGRCEYCRIPDEFVPLPFQIDHVIAQQHGGPSTLDNLAWACLACNNHKGPNLAGVDWQDSEGRIVPLFNPRKESWEEHFERVGARIEGTTPTGRGTVACLAMNLPHRVALRGALTAEGVW